MELHRFLRKIYKIKNKQKERKKNICSTKFMKTIQYTLIYFFIAMI